MTPRPARRSLAESFRPAAVLPDRSAGLEGLLPRKPDRGADAPTAEPLALVPDRAVGSEQGSGVADGAPEAGALVEPARPAEVRPDLQKVRNVAVYLPVAVLEAFRGTSRSREMTYADLLVEAAAAHLEDLQARFKPAAQEVGSGMPVRPTRGQPQPGVQVQLRLDGHQVAWLDEQAQRLGAPSRSALVVALLQAHLGVPA
jgi:hypothetical protein